MSVFVGAYFCHHLRHLNVTVNGIHMSRRKLRVFDTFRVNLANLVVAVCARSYGSSPLQGCVFWPLEINDSASRHGLDCVEVTSASAVAHVSSKHEFSPNMDVVDVLFLDNLRKPDVF